MFLPQKFSAKTAILTVASIIILFVGFSFASAQVYIISQADTANEAEQLPYPDESAEEEKQAEALVQQDEDVTPQDLGVGDPDILPGNPLYFFKGVGRTFQSAVTFDSVKEAQLKLKFANEKLMEAKKMARKTNDPKKLQDALKRYEEEIERLRKQLEKLSGKDKAKVEKLIEKAADNQIKHHKLLGKMMNEHEQIAAEIERTKAEVMKDFSEPMSRVVDPEVMKEKFIKAMNQQKGSAFKHFKHIEVLEDIKDKVPENARDAIEKAIEESSKTFEEEFARMEDDQQKLFNKYVEKMGGNEVKHLEAFDSLNAFADIGEEMFKEIEKAREKSRKRVEERMKSIKDGTRRKVFLAHLEDAKLEDARIIKELENNLSPENVTSILEIKYKMESKMRESFEKAESTGDLDNFFDEMEKFRDVHMLQALNEMEDVIPEDKKKFWEEMRKKAIEEMNQSAIEAQISGRLEEEMRQMAGFDPEHMQTIDEFEYEFEDEFEFFEEMMEMQAEKIKERFEHFREFAAEHPEETEFLEKTEEFKIRIEEDEKIRIRIEMLAPEIKGDFESFEKQEERSKISREKADETIQRAETLIKTLEEKLAAVTEEKPGIHGAREMLRMSKEHLDNAKKYRDENRLGAAFGKATAAQHLAGNGIRHLELDQFEAQRREQFMQMESMRMEDGKLPPMEEMEEFHFEDFEDFERDEDHDFEDFEMHDDEDDNDELPTERGEVDKICAQVITPARNAQTKECRTFSNSCLPDGWTPDRTCQDPDYHYNEGYLQTATTTTVPSTEPHEYYEYRESSGESLRKEELKYENTDFAAACKNKGGTIYPDSPLKCHMPDGRILEPYQLFTR